MHPILFHLGNIHVNSYIFFNSLALLVGTIVYFRLTAARKNSPEKVMLLFTGALAGGFLGATLVDLGSRTILGSLVGGYIGVKTAKKIGGIKEKTGDPFALSAVLAMGIGRIGCLLGGCCYGKPTDKWFGIFMAGQSRYPTQVIEMAFDFALFIVLWNLRDKIKNPGDLFKLFLFSYSTFRFFIEFIRTEPVIWLGLTVYQLIAIPIILITGIYFKRNCLGARNGDLYGSDR